MAFDNRRREDPGAKRLTQDELRSIRNARNCLGLKFGKYASCAAAIFTGIMAIGATSAMDAVIYGIIVALLAALAIVLHNVQKNRQTKWGKYEALINWQGNTSLEYISENTGYPMEKVIRDLQEMIDKKFLIGPKEDLGAYIDKVNELLVMTDFGTGKPNAGRPSRRSNPKATASRRSARLFWRLKTSRSETTSSKCRVRLARSRRSLRRNRN